VGKYRATPQISPLRYASRDARALARLLADPDVCGFSQDQIALLTDRDARRRPIVEHLSTWLPERSREADIAVIYFACHGLQQSRGDDEEGYLLPYDADPDEVVATGVAMAEVARLMNAVHARAVVVLLDCCYAGHVLTRNTSISRSGPRDLAIKPAVFEKLLGRNRFLLVACDKDQMSIEPPDLKHGLFTYHLLKGIAGAADGDGDGRVGVYELSTYVSQAVARDAPRFGHVQTPWAKGEWKENVFLSSPRHQSESRSPDTSALEKLWKELGPDRAMAHLERQLREEDEPWFQSVLTFLRRNRDAEAIPFLFHCLAHRTEAIRVRAKKLVEERGWEAVAAASLEVARRMDAEHGPERTGFLLEGLAAIEANPQVIRLLDEFGMILSGSLRARAILLLERKRLSIELEAVKALFDSQHSAYRIEKVLGQGLFTAAYLAKHEFTGHPVVVRVLRPRFVDDHSVRLQFLEVGKQCYMHYHHPGLVHTRDVQAIADSRIYYTVRDHIEGVTLQDVLAQGKKFQPLQVLEILRQVLEALAPIHDRGACHCGIKPSNLFLHDEERVRIILGDLSLPIPHFDLDRLCYDYRYAPPEMFRSGGSLCPQSDFYSLGCLGYELLCGAPPFKSDNVFDLGAKHVNEPIPLPSRNGSRLGPEVDGFFDRLLSKRPEDRFHTLSETIQALDVLRDQLRPPSQPRARPVTLLGRDKLGEFDPLHSVLALAESGGTDAPTKIPLGESQGDDTLFPHPGAISKASDSDISGGESSGELPAMAEPRLDLDRVLELAPGQVLFDRYIVERQLGEGGMGTVWLVRHRELGSERALKLMVSGIARDPQVRARFRREAQILDKLNHPNAVRVYDARIGHDIAFIEMEFVRGQSVNQILVPGQPMPLKWVTELLDQLCDVLQAANDEGITHRDLKPPNLMLVDGKQPGRKILKLLDFGIAKIREAADSVHTLTGSYMGTPLYSSPEQITGEEAVDTRSDIYSVGLILYELLTGYRPFDGSINAIIYKHTMVPPRRFAEVNPEAHVPAAVEEVVLKCLAKNPDQRPQSPRELAERFHAAVAQGTTHGEGTNEPQPSTTHGEGTKEPQPSGSWEWLRNLFRRRRPPAAGAGPPGGT
jgi:serine/threonine-protein kinase